MFGVCRLRSEAKSFGLVLASRAYFIRCARFFGLRWLKCIVIRESAPGVTETSPKYVCRFLGLDELAGFAKAGDFELDSEFLAAAGHRGDECFGILDGAQLAAYGWYTRRPTEIDHGLWLHFDKSYVYMYKGFTAPDYRGQRLHAVGMARALQAYRDRGSLGLVSYVDGDNLSSLKSCYRMGYRDFGLITVANWRFWRWSHASAGCRDFAFRVTSSQRTAEVEVSEPLAIERR